MSIRIGILGYGNLGRGVECAIKHNPDLELVAVFTRRAPETVKILTETAAVYSVNDAEKMKDKIDVLIICGGSATDLPKQTPEYAKMFNVIDSFTLGKSVKKDCLYQLLFTIRQQRQGGFQPVHHDRIDNGFCNVHRFISDKVQRIPLAVRKSVER